jgi:predicted LPLAT superfamily acyltransferase
MRHVVVHDLGLILACRTARAASADYAQRFQRFQPRIEWRDERRARVSFQARGLALAGDIELDERSLYLVLDVPLLLRPLQGRAVVIIERELRLWIERARRGELPTEA